MIGLEDTKQTKYEGAAAWVACCGLIFPKFLLSALYRLASTQLVSLALCLIVTGHVSCGRLVVLV